MTTGHIQAPSAFELWWDKKRRTITTVVTVILLSVVAFYGWRFFQRSRLDATWSNFAQTAGLRAGYSEPGGLAQILKQYPQAFDSYLGSIPEGLVSQLGSHVGRIDDKAFDDAIVAAAGSERAPLLMWVAANRALGERSFERAKTLLKQLVEKYPNHFLCQKSDYPPQYRIDLNKPEPGAAPDPKHVANLQDPVAGSVASLALARIERDMQFAKEHAPIYTAPEPESTTVAVVKTDFGEFKIGFFEAAAPKHVQTFVDRAKNGFFDKMAIDQIRRAGDSSAPSTPVEEMHFGLVATKEQQDRTKWDEERNKLDDKSLADSIEFEDSRISHFPMMVSASAGKDGKSLPTRICINVSDASSEHDGRRVVFGKVIAGEDVARKLVLDPVFSSEDERRNGRGAPRDTIRIQSITIETK